MRPFRTLTTLLFTILSLSLLTPREAQAQEYAQVVWDQLKLHHNILAQSNYSFLQYIISSERQSGRSDWTLPMSSGYSYALTAACDADCGDIDIRVKNAYGENLAEDADETDQAVVEFSPSASGQYTVEVVMYECQQEPCYYGVGIFHRNAE